MNVLIAIMLIFAAIGFLDKMVGSRWGLTQSFDCGLATMGGMAIPTLSTCCIAVELIRRNLDAIEKIAAPLPFDPSLIVGTMLAPDTGGFFIVQQLSDDQLLVILNGVVLAALLGQMVTYQIPLFLSTLDKEHHLSMMKGFVIGVVVIPIGIVTAELFLRIELVKFLWHFFPITVLCLLMTFGLVVAPQKVVKIFSVFASGVQFVVNVMFFIMVLGIFVPALACVDIVSVQKGLVIVFRAAIVICGSLVMSELILKFFRKQIQKLADRIGVNEVSAVAMLMNCATSLAILPLIPQMDEKGKMMNAAFSVSGAYVLGGQLGFVSSVVDAHAVMIMVIAKIVCGLLSMFIMHKMYRRMA